MRDRETAYGDRRDRRHRRQRAEGSTLLDAAKPAGVETPTLCYLENLTPVNVCRVCVVELEGSRMLVPACSRKAEEGMKVHTDSGARAPQPAHGARVPGLVASTSRWQRDFAGYAQRYGAQPERYGPEAATVAQPVKVDNELYVRDYSKCILCYKCVEACGVDAQNTFAIAVAGRGFDAHIATEFDSPAARLGLRLLRELHRRLSHWRAHVLDRVRDAQGRHVGRERGRQTADTICSYCGVGCTLTVHAQDNEIVKVTSPLDHSVTHGHLCIKGRFGWKFVGRSGKDKRVQS